MSATQTMTQTLTLPDFCHPSGMLHADYNGNCLDCGHAACKRNAMVYMVRCEAKDIAETAARRDRTRSAYVARNLAKWIEDAEIRLARSLGWIEQTPCTCATHGPGGHRKPEEFATFR